MLLHCIDLHYHPYAICEVIAGYPEASSGLQAAMASQSGEDSFMVIKFKYLLVNILTTSSS
jgi:hypothetical protein